MYEICKSLHEFPWRFLRWMLHILRHDECHWHRQKAATLYNQENDKYIAIRATYYIFCCRNRNWGSPDLMQFWIFFWLLFCFVSVFVFVFVFFFLIIQSQAAFLNCLHVARFTIVHSKTQIKFPLLLLYFFYGNDRFFPQQCRRWYFELALPVAAHTERTASIGRL